MKEQPHYNLHIEVQSTYIPEQSFPAISRFVFAYTVIIRNEGNISARLLSRHWIVTDATGKVQEVRGQGVVGEQPYLRPGESFQYTSGALLETSVGSMYGSYHLMADDGVEFDANIPAFNMSVPHTLH
ncbi:DUF525 domain-containing protein ApaG [Gammaproteobacteria bacterium]